jgi:hypothetical protein
MPASIIGNVLVTHTFDSGKGSERDSPLTELFQKHVSLVDLSTRGKRRMHQRAREYMYGSDNVQVTTLRFVR